MGGSVELTGKELESAKEGFAAVELWIKIKANLSDRGCFNGIDDQTMRELETDLIGLIRGSLSVIERTDAKSKS